MFYVEQNALMAVNVATETAFKVGVPRTLFSGAQVGTHLSIYSGVSMYDVAPGARRFVVVQLVPEAKRTFSVVQNWFAEFRDRQ